MQKGKSRHFFPGANTYLGFFSFYDHIISQEEAERLFILKGGPGVGKSSFMRKVGTQFQEMGYDVEYLHCSSDNNSLDGVKLPTQNIAFIDGTAPHVVDPKSPGAVDEILNFGDFWNQEGIRARKYEIIEINKEIGRMFSRAYKYLRSAQSIYEDSQSVYKEALDNSQIDKYSKKLVCELFDKTQLYMGEGRQRNIFASALTPEGYTNYLDTLLIFDKIYEFSGGMGTGEERILERIKAAAMERGLYVEACYCALNPYKLEHLLIPSINTALTSRNSYHSSNVKKYACFDMQEFLKISVIEQYRDNLSLNIKEFENLMSVALASVNKAKKLHDRLETFYVPNIRFNEIDNFFNEIMARIM